MTVYQRQQKIMNYMKEEQFSTVKDLAKLVYASESSIRRDIKALESAGYVKQTYGGIVLADRGEDVVPIRLRDSANSAIKDQLAKIAASYIKDGDTIFMDGSSTVRRIAKHLGNFKNLKIITNNVDILQECKNDNVKIYCTSGLYLPKSNICIGPSAEQFIKHIHADTLFFSSQAISLDGMISDSSEEESSLRRVMLNNATTKIFLCDSSKLGKKRTFRLCDRKEVDRIICDAELPWESTK